MLCFPITEAQTLLQKRLSKISKEISVIGLHNDRCAVRLTVTGMVQGIGYRPFVRREAMKRSLDGYVQNNGGGVCIYVCGEKEALDSFVRCLLTSPPEGTVYTSFERQEAEVQAIEGFSVAESDDRSLLPMAMPDLAPCDDCLRELFDRSNRRCRHPFISCASCGPRFSLQSALPYDRVRTSMKRFVLCAECADEYNATEGKRSYAQTLACPDCGPQLQYVSAEGQILARNDALDACIAHLREGGIDAIKNIGGFHLACRADDEDAVSTLRVIKGREEKPFALLFTDMDRLRRVAEVNEAEEALLTSSARPIVLLRRRSDVGIAPSVCRESIYIGAMLPSSPLQHLLVQAVGPLVMTSANRSGEPLCTDGKQLEWLPPTVGVLDNDRPIVAPQDDSVCFAADCAGMLKPLMLRRARGYAPLPIRINHKVPYPFLASGGDLKAVFALVKGEYLYPSPYIGDLEDLPTAERWSAMLEHMSALLSVSPKWAVCDLHPGYHSAKMAERMMKSIENNGVGAESIVKVQHHHAHIASVMAEHKLDRVLGFAFDGTGYGIDGSVWGGELLYCERASFKRLRHLKPLLILGGGSAAIDCRRTAATFLLSSGRAPWDEDSSIWDAALRAGVNSVLTSSMGRLFDAVASMLDICHCNAYEGQAATMLEACATLWQEKGGSPDRLTLAAEGDVWRSDKLLLELLEKKEKGTPIGALALGFHLAIADAVAETAIEYSRAQVCGKIALSGGVFANRLLLTACTERLAANRLTVCINEQFPAGDGNIAIGQAYIAAMREEE